PVLTIGPHPGRDRPPASNTPYPAHKQRPHTPDDLSRNIGPSFQTYHKSCVPIPFQQTFIN
ncbi:MAG: hypothetical protein AB7E95_11245, partial [Kiritimatiellales bacterium]